MQGVIFQQLQQFVTKNYGPQQWYQLLESSDLKGKMYLPTQVYPDSEVVTLVTNASQATNMPVAAILESFGEFIAPSLLKIYSASIQANWNTIDLLEHVENTIHKAVRFADKAATPPQLLCERKSANRISIDYSSKRNMADLGIGIIKAIAKIKNESISISKLENGGTTKIIVSLN